MNGIVRNLPEADYFADPSLSSTGARTLLESPAKYKYSLTHRRPDRPEFDLGSAVHSKVLGTGYGSDVIPDQVLAANGAVSTKAAKEFITASRDAGRIPIKSGTAFQVDRMAEAVLGNDTARALLEQEGDAEASVFATDPETGTAVRARFDYLPAPSTRRRVAVDLKTAATASEHGFQKAVATHRYDIQRAWYLDTLHYATGDTDTEIVYVVVETEAPYLVATWQLRYDFAELGQKDAARARRLHADCTRTGIWPGYPGEIQTLEPPMWLVFQNADEEEMEIA